MNLPEWLDNRRVAALLMKGMTAQYLLHRTYNTILVHAAAGGMGLILCQWAKALGATIVGTVSTDEKAEAARGASIDDIQSIAVYSTTGRSRTTSPDISAFLSGYLSNIKNYTAHNLDLYYVQSFVDARRKAAELGAGGLLAVHAESFT